MDDPDKQRSRAGRTRERRCMALVAGILALVFLFSAGCTNPGGGYGQAPATATPGSVAGGPVTTIDLVAQGMAFSRTNITVPAGAAVVVNFHNREDPGSSQVTGIAHNFAVYDSPAATTTIFSGEIITGGSDAVYRFTAPSVPGTYYFRCDVHPSIMNGRFIVQ